MTTAVTKESLAGRIAELESGPRSLKEDYTLAAYKMLLATMEAEPVACSAAAALRACLPEFHEDFRDIVEECADIAENACRSAMINQASRPYGGEMLALREAYAELRERYDLEVNPDCK